ncbi:capsular polysaccharide export protein, LipB/KpsS family [Shimia marina]|uniref:Capsule polysaccharide biosynthesis protein n=1 Tax=Shimia marina TaxID=321267 RepID=A0A0P1EV23_9RHOB|nr:hypothetical protein [Shimia marina]CUH53979.1 Capsule polysaccharide biosynthesis protein [Shimia marina]SFE17762.1 Capsule polysaccharide biosynthesis protein [Shimia marina]
MASKVVFHVPQKFVETYADLPHLVLFKRIRDLLQERGGKIEVRRRDEALRVGSAIDHAELLEPENLHIVENGVVRQNNALNAAVAYIPPYYHLDAHGVLARSAAAHAVYDPTSVNPVMAAAHFEGLYNRLVRPRRSRYNPKQAVSELPQECIAVFLQGDNPHRQQTAHCSNEQMLRAVAEAAEGRPIVVKTHPQSRPLRDVQLMHELLQEGLPLLATDANIHDILSKCAATVSFNSAVALEGFLHGKPAVLFGQSDFHHVCETVVDPDQFSDALKQAVNSSHDYGRFLYWYFSNHCVMVDDPVSDERILQAFDDAGFSSERLGLMGSHTLAQKQQQKLRFAQREAAQLLRHNPQTSSVSIRRCVRAEPEQQRFIADREGDKLLITRYLDARGAETVLGRQKAMEALNAVLLGGDLKAAQCVIARPDIGLLATMQVRGETLSQKMLNADARQRRRFVKRAAQWLNAVSSVGTDNDADTTEGWTSVSLPQAMPQEDRDMAASLQGALTQMSNNQPQLSWRWVLGYEAFYPSNFKLGRDVLCAEYIGPEKIVRLEDEIARFLIEAARYADVSVGMRTHGMMKADWEAFVDAGLLPDAGSEKALRLSIGQELLSQFCQPNIDYEMQEPLREIIAAYLADVTL